MNKQLKILNWNANFGGDEESHPAPLISDYISGFDIIVFDEVVFNDSLEKIIQQVGDYDIFFSIREAKKYSNQIVIATKKYLNGSLIRDMLPCNNELNETLPNFLQVQIEVENSFYNIVGVRILSEVKEKQFIQCEKLAKLITSSEDMIDNTIILGDFNCGELRGDSSINYDKVKDKYQYTYTGKISKLEHYNFHLIKELFAKYFVLKETCGEQKSWGISLYQKAINYGGAKIKNDLVIYSKNLEVISQYSWDFIRNNNELYLGMLVQNEHKIGNKIKHGFPDHAILKVDIIFDKKDLLNTTLPVINVVL